jgi:OmpA-OmpF porin, OOP family
MKALKFLSFAALIGAHGFGASAVAQEKLANLYVGGTLAKARWHACPNPSSCDSSNYSPSAFVGYQINTYFSVEGGFRNQGEARSPNATVKGKAWEAVGIAAWPVEGGLSIYGKLGLARSVLKGDGTLLANKETTVGPTFGLGVQVELTKNIALRGEGVVYPQLGGNTLPKGNVSTLGVGALWRFR